MNDIPELLRFPEIGNFDLSLVTSKPVLSVFFILYFILYFILTMILFYHWRAYGMRGVGVVLAETLFIVVSVILFGLAALSLSFY